MRRLLAPVPVVCFLLACSESGDPGPGVDQACTEDQSCAEGLSCVQLVCRDDHGPQIRINLPEPSTTYASDVLELVFAASLSDQATDDQVLLSLTPATDAFLGQAAIISGDQAMSELVLTDYVPSRPYHLRAQVTDAAGEPYENPSAQAEQVFFVRDADIPDTPQVAIVWPPAGYEHPFGVDLEIEVAVLPGSFEIVSTYDSVCGPIPDCTPIFAPECEDTCGPSSARAT